jgi:uncharacterized membrane protein SirB2
MTNNARRKDRWTSVLTGIFLVTLTAVYVVDEPALWLGWSIVAVVISGTVMILFNRNTPQEL